MNSKPSKSAKKREARAIDDLAKHQLQLSEEQLAGIPLDDELRDVVVKTRNMTARSALRRQRLYLAKQLRRADVTPIQRACDALVRDQHGEQRLFHQAERWRDRILQGGSDALLEFQAQTGCKSPRLAQLVSELSATLPETVERRIARDIFREIHAQLSAMM